MRKRFHNLKKPKARADWSKWNLYNISRMSVPPAANKTFFQQKWLAKSNTRAYHGEQIREGQWTRMFDRRLPAVVPMDHKVLAKSDGSDQAAGRGAGLDVDPNIKLEDWEKPRRPQKTPYMQMTYWPTERRLDTAIWRALFSSSVRQARQFVVHGSVKVNGKRMIYPGYLLNPGDMFQVEPERVLFATGARKIRRSSPETTQGVLGRSRTNTVVEDDAEDAIEDEEGEGEESEAAPESQTEKSSTDATPAEAEADVESEDPKQALKGLMQRAKKIMADPKERISGKRKQDLRAFATSVRKTMSRFRGKTYKASSEATPIDETIDSLEEALNSIVEKMPSTSTTEASSSDTAEPQSTTTAADLDSPEAARRAQLVTQNQHIGHNPAAALAQTRRDAELLHAALQRAQANPIDVRKPYATPWQPREFMSAFAFIPRYLEVNQNICSAVYLRHPVARPGLAEVPTPFGEETGALSFNWYLRRR